MQGNPADIDDPLVNTVPTVITVPKEYGTHTLLWKLAEEERNSLERKLKHIKDDEHCFRRFLPKYKVWVLDNKIKFSNVGEKASSEWKRKDCKDQKWSVDDKIPSSSSTQMRHTETRRSTS